MSYKITVDNDINDRDFWICFYDAELEEQIFCEEEIIRELAVIASDEKDGGLDLQYQRILDLKSDQISGFGALTRLKNEKLELAPPLEFTSIAEKTKLIIPISKKIIRHAFRFMNSLRKMDTVKFLCRSTYLLCSF